MEQFDLSDFCTTKAQAADFSSRLENVVQQIYATDFNLDNCLLEQFGIQKKDKFSTLLRDNEVNIEANSELQGFIHKVIEKVNSLPVVDLTLAFEPDQSTLRDLSEWFILNNKQVLFEIKIDKEIIAGAIIDYNGKHKDFSARSTFERIFNDSVNVENPEKEEETVLLAGHQSLEHFSFVRQ